VGAHAARHCGAESHDGMMSRAQRFPDKPIRLVVLRPDIR
jgi:hypothetical protein